MVSYYTLLLGEKNKHKIGLVVCIGFFFSGFFLLVLIMYIKVFFVILFHVHDLLAGVVESADRIHKETINVRAEDGLRLVE